MRKSVVGGAVNIIGAVLGFIGTGYLAVLTVLSSEWRSILGGMVIPMTVDSTLGILWIVITVGLFACALAVHAAVHSFDDIIVGGVFSASSCAMFIILSVMLDNWTVLVILAIIALAAGSVFTFTLHVPISSKQGTEQQPMPQPSYCGQSYMPPQRQYEVMHAQSPNIRQNTSFSPQSETPDDGARTKQ